MWFPTRKSAGATMITFRHWLLMPWVPNS